MRTASILVAILTVVSAAGCGSSGNVSFADDTTAIDAANDWIGMTDRTLVLKLGAPDTVYQLQNGSRILTWRSTRTENRGGEVYTVTETQTVNGEQVVVPVTSQKPSITWRYTCVLNIEVDREGYVVGHTMEGNDCSVQPPPD